jgi:filamentous hemagglutinin family protein
MSARVQPEPSQNLATPGLIRLCGRRVLRLVQRPRRRVSQLLAALLASWIPSFGYALDLNALPTQGTVQVGSGQISQNANTMVVTQSSARLGLDWQSFNIGANGSVRFVQPGKDAVALNRVLGNEASHIFGRLSANGQVFLVNPNGVLFAPGSKVDVGALVASSLDLSQDDFKNGKYQFVGQDSNGRVLNQGSIQGASGGYVALFGPQVQNEGSINVPLGQVVLAAGRAVTVDITGSGLISAVIAQGAHNSSAENSGTLSAPGGTVCMGARAAQDTVGGLVNNSGVIKANTLVNQNGEIWLLGDSVSSTGELRAEGAAGQSGGLIQVAATSVALGGLLSVDGASGGQVVVTAGERLSLADHVSARGLSGQGGQVVYASGGGVLESSSSYTNASGATDGGAISVAAASGVASSGHYYVEGATGRGGRIDASASTLYLLSAELDASGMLPPWAAGGCAWGAPSRAATCRRHRSMPTRSTACLCGAGKTHWPWPMPTASSSTMAPRLTSAPARAWAAPPSSGPTARPLFWALSMRAARLLAAPLKFPRASCCAGRHWTGCRLVAAASSCWTPRTWS